MTRPQNSTRIDSNELNADGDVLTGRFGCAKERREALKSNGKVLKDDVDSIKGGGEALKSNEKTIRERR